jgi:hypothetical protein
LKQKRLVCLTEKKNENLTGTQIKLEIEDLE